MYHVSAQGVDEYIIIIIIIIIIIKSESSVAFAKLTPRIEIPRGLCITKATKSGE